MKLSQMWMRATREEGGGRDPYYDDRKRSAREEYIRGESSRDGDGDS